ncbi:MAG: MMPL family transporter [Candidatus Methylacidiphilales bacterium]|nr:MMPL family transporter [Candidatus Methylacidiphilales bacterium]
MVRFRHFLQRVLLRTADMVYHHPRAVVTVSAILFVAASYAAAFHLGVINNINDLIRADSPVHKFYLDYKKEFSVREEMVVIITSDDFAKNAAAADDIGAILQQRTGDFDRVYYRHDFSRLQDKLLNFQTPEELAGIQKDLLTLRDVLKRRGNRLNLNTMLEEAIAGFDETRLRKEANWKDFESEINEFVARLDKLADVLENRSTTEAQQTGAKRQDLAEMRRQLALNSYLSFDEGKMILVLLTPTEGDRNSFSPYGDSIGRLRKDLEGLRLRHPGVDIGLTGEPVLLDDEMRQSTHDSAVASILTLVLIAVLFFFAYRELARPALAMMVLIVVIAWTMGLTVVFVGHLNVISQACVIMIMGLGIDFGVQILGRYEEELAHKTGVHHAVRRTLENTGLAVLTGGSTTAIAFFTMCFNDFIGLAELGIIAGMGMVAAVVAYIILLPALFVLRDRHREEVFAARPTPTPGFRSRLDEKLFARPGLALAMAAVLVVVAIVGMGRIRYDYNLLNLQNPKMDSVQYTLKLVNSPAATVIFGVIVADDLADARVKTAKLKELPTVRNVRSLDQALPPDQEAKLPLLRDIGKIVATLEYNPDFSNEIDVAKARAHIRQLLEMAREGRIQAAKYKTAAKFAGKGSLVEKAIEVFDRMIPPLERAVANFDKLSQDEVNERLRRYQAATFGNLGEEIAFLRSQKFGDVITLDDLPFQVRERYLSPSGKVLIEVDPKENVWEEEPNRRFVEDIRKVSERATGTPVQNFQYINLLRDSYIQAGGLAFIAIVLLVFLHFRSLFKLGLTLLPLGLGILYTFGFMGWFDIPFNPANIITLPLVIGIGVAFGVYVVDRHDEEGRVALSSSSTGKALFLSAATTIIGFSTMMTGEYRGLASLGLVMTLGVLFCFLCSTLILPQILTLMDRRKAKRTSQS